MRVFLFLLSFFFTLPVWASGYSLEGARQQGGLLLGTVEAGTHVQMDGKDILVSPEGYFVLGFGRDHGAQSRLVLTFPDGAVVEETLQIAKQEYKIQKIEGLPQKKVTPNPDLVKRIRADNALVGKTRQEVSPTPWFANGFDWPLKGTITGVFGSQRILNGKPRSPHKGVDIAAPIGTLIYADGDGRISLRHDDMYLMGKTLMIDHGHGLQSIYIHMDEILVTEGQMVKKGDPVGKVGKSGRATGPHLHWGVSWYSHALDPKLLVSRP